MPLPIARSASVARPTFSRDFAGLKTLDHGVGPAITFTRASNATFFNASGVLQTASNDQPRFDHDPATGESRGLLIEEARTNSIRNSQGGGATNGVIGSGGTMPTNWATSTASGIVYEVIGTGTENGLSFVDIKISGTNSSGSSVFPSIFFDTVTQVTATSGQSWSHSFYAKVAAGSTSGFAAIYLQIVESTAAAVTVASQTVSISPTSQFSRFSDTRTLTGATTERVYGRFVSSVANGSSINLTIRIAAPQLEQGAFPTSYIPTTTAAATRSADSVVVTPISSFYNQAEGTVLAEVGEVAGDTIYGVFSLNDGSEDNRIDIRRQSNAVIRNLATLGTVQQAGLDQSLAQAAQNYKAVAAYKTDDIAFVVNGGSVAADTSASLPTATHFRIGQLAGGAQLANNHIRKIAYWPKRLSNTLLQQLTT